MKLVITKPNEGKVGYCWLEKDTLAPGEVSLIVGNGCNSDIVVTLTAQGTLVLERGVTLKGIQTDKSGQILVEQAYGTRQ